MSRRSICGPLAAATTTLFFGIANQALALHQYRCAGRVQYRPCTETVQETQGTRAHPRPTEEASDPKWSIKGPRYAKVTNTKLAKLGGHEGLWSGTLAGNGLVETELQIYRKGEIEEHRAMGRIWLQNKSTPFRFKSVLPPGRDWEWAIVAWAR